MGHTSTNQADQTLALAEEFCRGFRKQKSAQHFFFRGLLEKYQSQPGAASSYEDLHSYIHEKLGRRPSGYKEALYKQPLIDLRAKLQERLDQFCKGRPVCLSIENVPGVGYRLLATTTDKAPESEVSPPSIAERRKSPPVWIWIPAAIIVAAIGWWFLRLGSQVNSAPFPPTSASTGRPPASSQQTTAKAWAETIGGEGLDKLAAAVETRDGDYILAGTTSSFGAGGRDIWVVRLSPSGKVKWQKTYGGAGDEEAYAVAATNHDGAVIAGSTNSFGAGGADAWVVWLWPDGRIEWQEVIGGPADDELYAVTRAKDYGFVLAGETHSYGASVSADDEKHRADAWVIKLDQDGNLQWQKAVGGPLRDSAKAIIAPDFADMFQVVGLTYSYHFGRDVEPDAWAFQLDPKGNLGVQFHMGGGGSEAFTSIAETRDQRFLMAGWANLSGYADSAMAYDDFFASKIEIYSSRNVVAQWQKAYGSYLSDEVFSVAQAHDGGLLLAGQTATSREGRREEQKIYNIWLMKLDNFGDPVWSRTYGFEGDEQAKAVIQTRDGGILVAGFTYSTGAGSADAWILKLNRDGKISDACPAGMGNEFNKVPQDTRVFLKIGESQAVARKSKAAVEATKVQPQDSAAQTATLCR